MSNEQEDISEEAKAAFIPEPQPEEESDGED